jgi:hypothetical protein
MDPALFRQIMGQGALGEQSSLADQEVADLIARRKAMNAQGSTTGAGALLSGIGDMIMGRKEAELRQKRLDLAHQMASGRQTWAQAYGNAQQGGGEAPAPEGPGGAPAFGAQPDPMAAQQLRTTGMLSGDPVIGGYLKQEPTMQLHQEQMRKIQEENQAIGSPQAQSAYAKLAKAMGLELPEGTPAATMRGMLPTMEKLAAAREAASARRDSAQYLGSFRRDAQQAREDQARDKRWTQFGQELDPARGRAGPLGKQLDLQAQIDRDLGLIQQNPNPTDQQIYELARGLDRAISGAAPTMGSTEHLVPSTLLGKVRGVQQFLTNKPTGADKQAFVAQMGETLQRLRDATQGNIRQWQGKKASRYSDLAKNDQARFEAELQNWGLGADEFDPQTWVYKGKAKSATAPAGPAGEDAEALAWAKANPADPRAQKILQLQGTAK